MPVNNIYKKIKFVISIVIFALIGTVLSVFILNRIHIKNIQKPLPPQQTTATLSIQNFRHTSTQNGREEWSIEAKSAKLFSTQNIAELTNISASFFLKNNETVFLTADSGLLHIDTNNLSLSGHIHIRFSAYVLTTESLNYNHNSHIVIIDTPVMISGNSMSLKANTLSYNLKTDITTCSGDVEGTFKQVMEQ